MGDAISDYLQVAHWRRRVASIYARWREESEADPAAATATWRLARDELFRSHPQSPIPTTERARFGGLSYFDYDPDFRMRAVVEPADLESGVGPDAGSEADAAIQLPTSGDEPFSFRLIGRARLSGPLTGSELPVFWMEGYAGGLFIPFRDATAGTETYGAGRYLLDTVKGADQGGDPQRHELVLDFNLAYHPSCTYDPRWNCPLAPLDSRLSQAIRVGERLG